MGGEGSLVKLWEILLNNEISVSYCVKKGKRRSGVGVYCELKEVTGGRFDKNMKKCQDDETGGSQTLLSILPYNCVNA